MTGSGSGEGDRDILSYDTPVSTISMYALAVTIPSMKYTIIISLFNIMCRTGT